MTSIALTLLLGFIGVSVSAQTSKDTTFIFNQKKITVQDSLSQVKVTVSTKDSADFKKVYEGIFTDERTFERFNVIEEIGFNIPFLKKKKYEKMEPHWAGFGYGKLTLSDSKMHIGKTDGIPLDKGKSSEVTLNIIEGIVPVFGHTIGLTSGFGLDWRNYHLEGNTHLLETNGVTSVKPATEGLNYTYSRLRTLHLTVPVLLEWQPTFGKNRNFFVTAGVVGGWNVMASYRVKYKNSDGDKVSKKESSGLKTNPLALDIVGQIGYSNIGLYLKIFS
ncbi:MAG: outer membrane beta-barrel protein [Paludibacteraceae bacterium]